MIELSAEQLNPVFKAWMEIWLAQPWHQNGRPLTVQEASETPLFVWKQIYEQTGGEDDA